MLSRRALLYNLGVGTMAATLPAITFARAETSARLVLVIQRGAVDGLALAPPYGEPGYAKLRGRLALPSPGDSDGVQKLDGLFGLHPALENVLAAFRDGDAAVLHAVASPYRQRSHFDGQAVLENGAAKGRYERSGWLNRALEPLGGGAGNEVAIAMAENTPLVLRGDNSVISWSSARLPQADLDTLQRIEELYAHDEFFAVRFAQALESRQIADDDASMNQRVRRNDATRFRAATRTAARFLTAPDGPRIAVIETGGWDTHANQGASGGQLARKFRVLDQGLGELRTGLGEHWADTVVLVVTEFGRTVRVNGTGGTDHGTAAAALALGGAVNGGRVVSDWPGLRATTLWEGRDLYPTGDVRSLFKAALIQHLGLDQAFVDARVFPDSDKVKSHYRLFLRTG